MSKIYVAAWRPRPDVVDELRTTARAYKAEYEGLYHEGDLAQLRFRVEREEAALPLIVHLLQSPQLDTELRDLSPDQERPIILVVADPPMTLLPLAMLPQCDQLVTVNTPRPGVWLRSPALVTLGLDHLRRDPS